MSRSYKTNNLDSLYFVSFATVGWIDVFTRREYKDILVDSLKYCQKEKGLELYGWCIMSNHVHLIARSAEGVSLSETLRDFKKYTSVQLIKAIEDNIQESRKDWMLSIFKSAGNYNSNNKHYQFWRQDNKPVELYSQAVIQQKLDYVHNNPVVDGLVEESQDYLYSSARNYAGEKGLIQLYGFL